MYQVMQESRFNFVANTAGTKFFSEKYRVVKV